MSQQKYLAVEFSRAEFGPAVLNAVARAADASFSRITGNHIMLAFSEPQDHPNEWVTFHGGFLRNRPCGFLRNQPCGFLRNQPCEKNSALFMAVFYHIAKLIGGKLTVNGAVVYTQNNPPRNVDDPLRLVSRLPDSFVALFERGEYPWRGLIAPAPVTVQPRRRRVVVRLKRSTAQ